MKLDVYLEQVGMKDTELANACGVNRSRISRIRRGLERPGWELAAKIKLVTGGEVRADDFLPDIDATAVSRPRVMRRSSGRPRKGPSA